MIPTEAAKGYNKVAVGAVRFNRVLPAEDDMDIDRRKALTELEERDCGPPTFDDLARNVSNSYQKIVSLCRVFQDF